MAAGCAPIIEALRDAHRMRLRVATSDALARRRRRRRHCRAQRCSPRTAGSRATCSTCRRSRRWSAPGRATRGSTAASASSAAISSASRCPPATTFFRSSASCTTGPPTPRATCCARRATPSRPADASSSARSSARSDRLAVAVLLDLLPHRRGRVRQPASRSNLVHRHSQRIGVSRHPGHPGRVRPDHRLRVATATVRPGDVKLTEPPSPSAAARHAHDEQAIFVRRGTHVQFNPAVYDFQVFRTGPRRSTPIPPSPGRRSGLSRGCATGMSCSTPAAPAPVAPISPSIPMSFCADGICPLWTTRSSARVLSKLLRVGASTPAPAHTANPLPVAPIRAAEPDHADVDASAYSPDNAFSKKAENHAAAISLYSCITSSPACIKRSA